MKVRQGDLHRPWQGCRSEAIAKEGCSFLARSIGPLGHCETAWKGESNEELDCAFAVLRTLGMPIPQGAQISVKTRVNSRSSRSYTPNPAKMLTCKKAQLTEEVITPIAKDPVFLFLYTPDSFSRFCEYC